MKAQFAIIDKQGARHAVVDSNPRVQSALRVTWEESGETQSIVFDKDRYVAVPYLSPDFWQMATPLANGRFIKEHPLEFYIEVLETLSKGTSKVITLEALSKKVKELRRLPKATLGRPNQQIHNELKRLFKVDEAGLEFSFSPDHGIQSSRPDTIVVESVGAAQKATSPLEAAKLYFAPASHLVASKDFHGLAFDVEATATLIRYISDNTQKWSIREAYEKSSELGDSSRWSELVLLITFGARAEVDAHIKTWTSVQVNADYFAEMVNLSLYANLHSISERTNFANLAFECLASHGNAFIDKLSQTGFSDFLASFADLAQISANESSADLVFAFVKRTEKEFETDFVSGLQKIAVRMLNSPNPAKVKIATHFLNAVSKQRRLDLSARASARRGPIGGHPEALRLEMDSKMWLSGLTFENLGVFNANDEFVGLLQTDHFKEQVVEQISKPFASEPWDSGKFQAFFSAKKWLQELIYKNVASEQLAEGIILGNGVDPVTRALFSGLVPSKIVSDRDIILEDAKAQKFELARQLKTVEARARDLESRNAKLEADVAELLIENKAKFDAAVDYKAGYWFRALEALMSLFSEKLGHLPNQQILLLSLQTFASVGLTPIGIRGEIVLFTGERHELDNGSCQEHTLVEVVVPGICFADSSGMIVVRRKAIVKVADKQLS